MAMLFGLMRFFPFRRFLSPLCACLMGVALGACVSRIDSRGNLVDAERLSEIKIGTHTREQVSEIIGSPSSTAIFSGETTWYYISKRTETFAFFEPRQTDSQVIVLRFGEDGVLEDINRLGMENARIVNPVARETPTSGNEMGILDQVNSNLKRFRKRGESQQQVGQ